jgi:carbon monoxide dehydrogenase subunit G
MIIQDEFRVDGNVENVWSVLKDIPRVAGCIPGAQVTDVVDPKTYRAKVALKVGPVSVSYNATILVDELDEVAHRARFTINGDEIRGRGGVRAAVTSQVIADGDKSRVTLHADAKISGVIASVGGRLIEGVAKKSIATFAENLSKLL